MSEPFLSEIRIMSFNFAPQGWVKCNGQFLPINQNQALFSLLGTTYGGNGQTTFQLPNLQGRVPIHFGQGHSLGETSREIAHTLLPSEMPTHTHLALANSGNADTGATAVPPGQTVSLAKAFAVPQGGGQTAVNRFSTSPAPDLAMAPAAISTTGGNQAHNNMQPYLALNFCIALQGIFPSQN